MHKKYFIGAVTLVAMLALAGQPAEAQCGNLIFRVTQGNYEQSFSAGQPIVLRPNQDGSMRVYWRGGGESIYTLAAIYNNPREFGWQGGQDPIRMHQVFRMDPQTGQARNRGVVRFKANNPGQVNLGFILQTTDHVDNYRKVPNACRSGILTISVQGGQPRGGGGGNAYPPPANNYPPPAQQAASIAGRYTTDYGTLVLQQQGNRVWGNYEQNGSLQGQLQGNVLRGQWQQPPNQSGTFEFTFDGGNQFRGAWRYGNAGPWEAGWNGRRTGN